MIYAEILAGGIGSRMNLDIPKQFIKINNKEIILYTIDSFYKNKRIDKIIICVDEKWKNYLIDLIKTRYDINKFDFPKSGINRNESMINGCKFIKQKYGINDNDIIITIDAVRMFVTEKIINDNIEAAKIHNAVGTFFPVIDTIMHSSDGKQIDQMPIRNFMYQAQAPQTFNIKKLIKYYSNLNEDEKESLTDVSKIFFLNKENVYMVNGDSTNIKITYQNDIEYAKAFIRDKK